MYPKIKILPHFRSYSLNYQTNQRRLKFFLDCLYCGWTNIFLTGLYSTSIYRYFFNFDIQLLTVTSVQLNISAKYPFVAKQYPNLLVSAHISPNNNLAPFGNLLSYRTIAGIII